MKWIQARFLHWGFEATAGTVSIGQLGKRILLRSAGIRRWKHAENPQSNYKLWRSASRTFRFDHADTRARDRCDVTSQSTRKCGCVYPGLRRNGLFRTQGQRARTGRCLPSPFGKCLGAELHESWKNTHRTGYGYRTRRLSWSQPMSAAPLQNTVKGAYCEAAK